MTIYISYFDNLPTEYLQMLSKQFTPSSASIRLFYKKLIAAEGFEYEQELALAIANMISRFCYSERNCLESSESVYEIVAKYYDHYAIHKDEHLAILGLKSIIKMKVTSQPLILLSGLSLKTVSDYRKQLILNAIKPYICEYRQIQLIHKNMIFDESLSSLLRITAFKELLTGEDHCGIDSTFLYKTRQYLSSRNVSHQLGSYVYNFIQNSDTEFYDQNMNRIWKELKMMNTHFSKLDFRRYSGFKKFNFSMFEVELDWIFTTDSPLPQNINLRIAMNEDTEFLKLGENVLNLNIFSHKLENAVYEPNVSENYEVVMKRFENDSKKSYLIVELNSILGDRLMFIDAESMVQKFKTASYETWRTKAMEFIVNTMVNGFDFKTSFYKDVSSSKKSGSLSAKRKRIFAGIANFEVKFAPKLDMSGLSLSYVFKPILSFTSKETISTPQNEVSVVNHVETFSDFNFKIGFELFFFNF